MIEALSGMASSLYSGMQTLPTKTTSYLLACTEQNIERAKRGYESAVKALNNDAEKALKNYNKTEDPETYQAVLEDQHEVLSSTINQLTTSKTQLEACNVNLDSATQLSDKAYEILVVPEFAELTPLIAASAIGIGLAIKKLYYDRKFSI